MFKNVFPSLYLIRDIEYFQLITSTNNTILAVTDL